MFVVRKNDNRTDHAASGACKGCQARLACDHFETAWVLMTAFIDEMTGLSIGTTCGDRDTQSIYDTEKASGHAFMAVATTDTTVCSCIENEEEESLEESLE